MMWLNSEEFWLKMQISFQFITQTVYDPFELYLSDGWSFPHFRVDIHVFNIDEHRICKEHDKDMQMPCFETTRTWVGVSLSELIELSGLRMLQILQNVYCLGSTSSIMKLHW